MTKTFDVSKPPQFALEKGMPGAFIAVNINMHTDVDACDWP